MLEVANRRYSFLVDIEFEDLQLIGSGILNTVQKLLEQIIVLIKFTVNIDVNFLIM